MKQDHSHSTSSTQTTVGSDDENNTKNDKKDDTKNDVKHFIIRILVLGMVIYLISQFIYQVYFVSGRSMEPTLKDHQPVVLQKFSLINSIHANDIIVIKAENVHTTIIKRVIGIPGDQVMIKDGIVYVNDSLFAEANAFPSIDDPGTALEPVTLKEHQFFVLGDNRNNSLDSRFEQIGIIEQTKIIGKVVFP